MMIFDTDILIWVQKGNKRAIKLTETTTEKCISTQTYMELLQSAQSKKQQQVTLSFLNEFEFEILPITQNIGHRAAIYIEEYSLSNGMRAGDALIAATAIENNKALSTGNKKHFVMIPNLQLKVFKP